MTHSMGELTRGTGGRFLKGSGGRPVGAKNKIRQDLKLFIENNLPDMQQHYDVLDPKEKIKVLNELLPFVIAKLSGISQVDNEGNDVEPQASINYSKLSPAALDEILNATQHEE